MQLNASDDRGIDVVRDQIKSFASSKTLFRFAIVAARTLVIPPCATYCSKGFKLILLDEADSMTKTAQMALRRGLLHASF